MVTKKKTIKKKEKKLTCVICQKEIKKTQDYFKVELYSKGKKQGTDYAHKECHQNTRSFSMPDLNKIDLNKLIEAVEPILK